MFAGPCNSLSLKKQIKPPMDHDYLRSGSNENGVRYQSSSNTGFVNVSSAHFPTVITKDHNINGHINTVYIIHTATIE